MIARNHRDSGRMLDGSQAVSATAAITARAIGARL
jgi:hypothetical protein